MKDKVQKIREKVVEMVNNINPFIPDEDGKNSDYEAGKLDAATQILQIIDSFEEPVSEDLEDAINVYSEKERLRKAENESHFFSPTDFASGFKAGARWKEEHLWKPADGDDLPIIDREVIALEGIIGPTATDCFCGYKVVFAHRPTPEGYDGKSIATGVAEHYTPETYGEGGWNVPNIAYWLDIELPKEIEL